MGLSTLTLTAQDSYRITVAIEGYDEPILTLANNVLDKQYIVDTARVDADGKYVFRSDTSALPGGIYLVVTAPDNNYFQVLVDADDQVFDVQTSVDDLNAISISGSLDNQNFVEYMAFLGEQGKKGGPISELLADSTLSDAKRASLNKELEVLEREVATYQDRLLAEHPESFTALIIQANRPFPPPPFDSVTDEEQRREKQYRWLQQHYFDALDLTDERLLRTPFLLQRVEYFTDKLHVQHPDSISQAIDKVVDRMDPASELYKYYVVHFTNRAASSKIVGHDAIYVHMVDEYYRTGKTYWTEPDQLTEMTENVDKLRPLLIGKQAPDIAMKKRDGTPVRLHDVDAPYTILYFWAYDCGHCKKSTPHMKEFYEKWNDRGVEIFSICTKQNELEKCWEYVDDNEIGDWMHVTDRYMRFYQEYDIRSTPTIFVLDENKRIVSKRIGAEQLDGLLKNLDEQRKVGAAKTGK